MGRGGGCIPSKSRKNKSSSPLSSKPDGDHPGDDPPQTQCGPDEIQQAQVENEDDPAVEAAVAPSSPPETTIKVYIIFYSMYGHVEALAKKIKQGVDSVDGAEGFLFRVAENLSQAVLDTMHAPPKDESIPTITAAQLVAADAFLFGFPTRYGAMAAQMKAFFDSTGSLWQQQKLAGKPAGFFVSTGTQGGGQETTAWTAITQLAHHGMVFIPIGYTFGAGMFKLDDLRGGSPYGAGTFAGDGSRLPTQTELELAEHQGRYTAGIAKRLVNAAD
ncbi:probable NAD(P)H dehydrogenase (quinone) FQR1-like 1 [Selaginella moellendorffii]|nr:probable NAD(P)H dehydrogenase (quinone) FQR1-like 1 [Selaginella moellendorffii]|eukprot:XP_002960336.2 probable NAD(P)H dehydrogenase (quinone) FQR1-like 1 [Selaginella moellendorffii]